MRNCVLSLTLFLVLSSSLAAQCSTPNGLNLGFSGGRLGDPFSLDVAGTPGVSGVIGIDSSPGPVSSPYGTLCLGLSSALQLLPFTLDGNGGYSLAGIAPADSSLSGFTRYLQAGANDSSQPGGFALSQGISLKMRPPRIYFIEPGTFSPFGITPGKWCGYDTLSDYPYTPAISLPSSVTDVVLVKSLGWLAFLLGNGTVTCYDTTTGAQTLSFPVIGSPGSPAKLGIDGTTLYLLHPGTAPNPFTSGQPGGLRTVSLPSGTYGLFAQLPAGNPDDFMVIGGGIGYARTGTTITPLDITNGTALAPIALGGSTGVSEWIRQGNILYCMMPGGPGNPLFGIPGTPCELTSIDVTTHTLIHGTPIGLPGTGPGSMMRIGPGSGGGNTLFVYNPGSVPPMLEINPATLQPFSAINTSTVLTQMTLTAGGTEWLTACYGQACPLTAWTPPTMAPTPIGSVPDPQDYLQLLVAVPSATMRKAYTVYKDHNSSYFMAVPIFTDPTILPFYGVALPIASGSLRCVVD